MHGALSTMTLNRHGKKRRKRATGDRTATGRSRERQHDPRALVAAQPHRRWLPESLRAHERAESVLGCLNLLKRISEHQFEAGRRFSVIVGAHRAVIGVPKGTIGSGRSYACEPMSCLKDPQNCLCEIRTAKFRDATHVLILAGQRAYNVTYQVAISDMRPADEQLPDLICGLDALAKAFGLTNRAKS